MHTLVPGIAPGLIDGGGLIMLPDQLDLDIAPIANHHGKIDLGWCAKIMDVIELDVVERKKRPRAHHLSPVLEGLIKIGRDIGDLHHSAQAGNGRLHHSAALLMLAAGRGMPMASARAMC